MQTMPMPWTTLTQTNINSHRDLYKMFRMEGWGRRALKQRLQLNSFDSSRCSRTREIQISMWWTTSSSTGCSRTRRWHPKNLGLFIASRLLCSSSNFLKASTPNRCSIHKCSLENLRNVGPVLLVAATPSNSLKDFSQSMAPLSLQLAPKLTI